ncbi:endothelin-converting enzyme 1-like isoform X2 [Dermacentor albipictus]|uniref:endothelin-converting enzyme 1-like isoform X2 n=1 Tax=Dermacentor albipictus TaxID=60249 RepID=UPI0038FCFC67
MDASTTGTGGGKKSRRASRSSRRGHRDRKASTSSSSGSSRSSRRNSERTRAMSSPRAGCDPDATAAPMILPVSAALSPPPKDAAEVVDITPATAQLSAYETADTTVTERQLSASPTQQTRRTSRTAVDPVHKNAVDHLERLPFTEPHSRSSIPVPAQEADEATTEIQRLPGRLIRPRMSEALLLTDDPIRACQQEDGPVGSLRKGRRVSTFQRFRDVGRAMRSSLSSSFLETPVVEMLRSRLVRRISLHGSNQERIKALNAASTARTEKKKGKEPFRKMVFYLLVRVVVTVLVLGLVVAVVMLLTPQPRPPELCRSHSCMQYAERLLQSMNTSADPCDSFTRFVCSGWTEHNVLSVHLSMLDSALSRLSRFARSASASLSHPRTAAQIGAAFFHSCDVVIRDNRNEMANVRRALAEAGVAWPGRAIGKPDALHTLLFAAIHLGWTAILHVDIRPGSRGEPSYRSTSSRRQTDTVVLTLSREFGMLARKHSSQEARRPARIAYVGLLNDNLGSGGDDVSASTAYEVADRVDSEFLDPLASIVGDRTARTTALENSTIFKGRPALVTRWRDALSSYGVPAAHDVLLRNHNSDFVRTFIEIWESNGEAETHMFVSWCIVQVAALFASQRLINSFYESEQHARVLHGVFCLAHTYLLTGFELFAGYSAEVSHAGAREDADALVRAVRGEFYRLLARWPHRDSNVTVVADWNSTAVTFSAVDRTSPESGRGFVGSGGVWSGQPVAMGDSLVTNWRLAAAAARVVSRSPQRAAVAQSMQALAFHANVGKDFLLLPYAFAYPLYDADAARAMNYAGMGSQVVQALGELFLAAYRSSSPPAREPILEFMHCVQPDASSARQDESQMMQVLSFNVLFDTYRTRAEAGDKRLVGLEALTLPQLLFVAACYANCPGGGLPSPAFYIAGVPDLWPGAEPHCDAMLRRTRHFARTFECAPGKHMNTGADGCSLFP